jgi:hypothetical protein
MPLLTAASMTETIDEAGSAAGGGAADNSTGAGPAGGSAGRAGAVVAEGRRVCGLENPAAFIPERLLALAMSSPG